MSSEWKKPAFLALSCVSFASAAETRQQDKNAPPPKEVELQGVAVSASAIAEDGYKAEAVSPKAVAPLVDTPRSIVVIGEQLIKDTGSATLVDALRTVPGITFGAAEGGNPVGDRPFIRGFDSQGSTYVDGLRDIGAQSREVFAIEQVQVVRGSDSALGGRGSAGGSINIVTKMPKSETFLSGDASYGSSDYKRATADVNYKINDFMAVRIAGMWHDQDVAGRDALFQKRWGVAPSFEIGLGMPTRLTVSYYHLHTSELPDSGLPYTYVCSATVCNAPAGSFVLSQPVHKVTTLGGVTGVVPYSTFYGLKNRDFRKSNTDQATLRVEHDFADGITLTNLSRYNHTWQGYIFLLPDDSTGNVVGTAAVNTTTAGVTNFINGGYVWRRANTRRGYTDSIANQTNLAAKFDTGAIKHSVALGAELSYDKAERGTYVLSTGSTITPRCNTNTIARYYCTSLFSPNPNDPFVNYTSDTSNVATPIARSPDYGNIVNEGTTYAGYLFDSISIGEKLIVNLGVRYDDFGSRVEPGQAINVARFRLTKHSKNWNYQGGLVFKPTADTSLYASYATSATPPNALLGEGQEQNAVGTTNTAAALALLDQLKVEKTKSYEAGAKADLFDGALSLTAAVFRTSTQNARVTVDAGTVAFVGERRTQGFELGYNGRILPGWTVFGGYSYLDAKIRDGGLSALTAAAFGAQAAKTVYVTSVNTGKQFPQTAKHSITAWTNYELGKFSIGGGAFYNSRQFGGYADNRRAVQDAAGNVTIVPATTVLARSIPGYWRFDARAGFKINEAINLSVNAQNFTNKRYFSQAYSSHYGAVAPGRTVFGTVSLSY